MPMYRIHRFSKLTGLSPHVIRAWERRYGLVTPIRGENRYRLYTDEDVVLFRYLKSQVDQGMAIGELSEQGREHLQEQAQRVFVETYREPPPSERLVIDLSQALEENDRAGFERKLNGALAVIPFEEALHRFLLPLQERIGQLWHDGILGVGQEHYASNQIKQKIFSAMNQFQTSEEGPAVVIACPTNEWHEVAAMTAAFVCLARGCRVHYLGANLPIPELAAYCDRNRPTCVLLSVTIMESSDEACALAQELAGKIVPRSSVGIGGQGIQAHAEVFSRENIIVFQDLKALDRFVFSLKH
ncbi:MerR family transcriptional regulator [uncultured Nitrospira sp.]|uniref:MerR family transcriptional regulator n=1 Tax=uncultured Nitrospira sp. TaxID=157176 RepID=UPI0031406AD6